MKWFWESDAQQSQFDRDLRPLAALFPGVGVNDVQAALALIPLDTSRKLANGQFLRPAGFFSEETRRITWQGTPLAVPYRLYVREPAPEAVQRLTARQRQVLHCLYLRHYDGYLRQRHLEALFAVGANSVLEAFYVWPARGVCAGNSGSTRGQPYAGAAGQLRSFD